jgi:mono/diheme cytochrome c family protein
MQEGANRRVSRRAPSSATSVGGVSFRRMGVRNLVLSLLGATLAVSFTAAQTAHPWPPPVQKVNDESPVLSPEDEMKTFFMPPGYHVELVASEPMIEEPILIDWDADGRLWVLEMPAYMRDIAGDGEHDPVGRVSVLEDTNGDGKMDKKTVFLDGLVQPRALKVLQHGVLVGEPPNLWLARDTNGDLKADTKELVASNYGQAMANVEHNANGLMWGLDNWIHTSEHNGYLRLKNGRFENEATLSRGQWGLSMDDAGRIYRNTNEAALFVDLISARYFMRNPNLLRTRGSYESLQNDEVNTVWPVRPTRGVNRGYQTGILRPDGTLAHFTSVSAPTVYRGDRLPSDLYGNVFVVEPAANLVSRLIVTDDETGLTAKKAYEHGEFLASTDERFRPVYLSSAPDGTLYVVDMYHGIIQHKTYITEYLRDQILSRRLDRPNGHGRIYRIIHDTTKRGPTPALSRASAAQLVDALADPNGWWRDTAQRLLVERGDQSVGALLKDRAGNAPDWRTRVHALWTLDGLDVIDRDTVVRALHDSSRDVRVSALQLAERWLSDGDDTVQAAVLACATDADWAVRKQLAATVGALPAESSAKQTALADLLDRFGGDPVVVDAALSGLAGHEAEMLARLLRSTAESPPRRDIVTVFAATVMKANQDRPVQDLLSWIAEENRPAWQREALLSGTEAVALGRPLPGATGRGAAAFAEFAQAQRGTAAGARRGPGGAPAFPRENDSFGARGRGRGRGSAGTTIALTREPAAFTALASQRSDVGERAANVAAHLTWPGKPVSATAAVPPPLTAEEQQRFEAGRTVYTTLCMACHQEDGRGRENLAATLVGSALALAPPAVTARILLNGKEGSVGLMPPLGATLTDEQIAAVLTYVRRSWGNAGSPVDVNTVKQTRALTADRTRPWTNEELLQLAAGAR